MVRLVLMGLVMLQGCGTGTEPSGTLRIQIHSPAEAPLSSLGADTLRISISGDDLPEPMVEDFPFSAHAGSFSSVPYGLSRVVTVEAMQGSGFGATTIARGSSLSTALAPADSANVNVFIGSIERFAVARPYLAPGSPAMLTEGRVGHTTTALADGRILIAGGAVLNGDGTQIERIYDTLEIYDPQTGAVSVLPTRLEPARAFHTATRLRGNEGYVLLTGGMTFINGELVTVPIGDIFDPTAGEGGSLFPTMNMWQARARHTATLRHDGTVLVTGGVSIRGSRSDFDRLDTDASAVLRLAELFRVADYADWEAHGCNNPEWAFCQLESMADKRADHAAVRVGDSILIVGGQNKSGRLASTEFFALGVTQKGDYAAGPDLTQARVGATVIRRLDESVVVLGGEATNAQGQPELLDTIELYDPTRAPHEFVVQAANTGIARRDASATLVGEDTILMAGGRDALGDAISDARTFTASRGTVEPGRSVGSLSEGRVRPALVAMDTGAVLVVGGFGVTADVHRFPPGLEIYTP